MKTTFAGKCFAQASAENNPFQAKLTFVFTDFEPNSNKERVLPEEAANLIATGKYAPIKILFGRSGPEGHPGSYPVGPITNLYLGEYKGNPAILGEAVLWKREFPFIDDFLAAAEEGEVQFSWELGYTSASVDKLTGVKNLHECSVRATTIVDKPAYRGRTPMLSYAEALDTVERLETELHTLRSPHDDGMQEDNAMDETPNGAPEPAIAPLTDDITPPVAPPSPVLPPEQDPTKQPPVDGQPVQDNIQDNLPPTPQNPPDRNPAQLPNHVPTQPAGPTPEHKPDQEILEDPQPDGTHPDEENKKARKEEQKREKQQAKEDAKRQEAESNELLAELEELRQYKATAEKQKNWDRRKSALTSCAGLSEDFLAAYQTFFEYLSEDVFSALCGMLEEYTKTQPIVAQASMKESKAEKTGSTDRPIIPDPMFVPARNVLDPKAVAQEVRARIKKNGV